MDFPKKGFYYHYKHDPKGQFDNCSYEVIGVCRNTEEETYSVLYRPLYENDWLPPADCQSRPLDMFIEEIIKDGKAMQRFEQIEDKELISKLQERAKALYSFKI